MDGIATGKNPSLFGDLILSGLYKAPGDPGTPADKGALMELVGEAEMLDEGGYTEDSWAVFAEALAGAKAVLADAEVRQADVDAAWVGLQAAMDALVDRGPEVTFAAAFVISYFANLKSLQGVNGNSNSSNSSSNSNNMRFTVYVLMSDGSFGIVDHAEYIDAGEMGSTMFDYGIYSVFVAWNDNQRVVTCEVR